MPETKVPLNSYLFRGSCLNLKPGRKLKDMHQSVNQRSKVRMNSILFLKIRSIH